MNVSVHSPMKQEFIKNVDLSIFLLREVYIYLDDKFK